MVLIFFSNSHTVTKIPKGVSFMQLFSQKFGMFQVDVNNIHHVHSIMFCFTTFVTGNNGKEGIVMPK